jgi:dienelactone hydrolase
MTVNPLSRREVIKFGAFTTVGGVLTPGISMAQAIVTDAKGINARDIQLDVAGTKIPGYEARPEAPGRYPIVVVISGFTGVTEQPKAQSFARVDRVGVTGFCGGGALTLHFTAENPDVTAAVPWYGHVKRVYNDAPGVDAFSLVSKIKVPVLGLYGEADSGIPTEDVKRFEAELKKTNPNVEFVLYPGAPHAFFSDDRPQVYKKDAAEDAWKRCIAFFDRTLKS